MTQNMINRRSAIRNIVVTAAGILILPSCETDEYKSIPALKKIKISNEQAKLLAHLTVAIIPTTDTPGAKEQKSDEFIMIMADDCASPEDQQKFMHGFSQFDEFSQKSQGKKFVLLSKAGQKELLSTIENKQGVPKEVEEFYHHIKEATIQSYTGGKYYLTTVLNYNIIPKKYRGCVPVSHA
jgi:hypothetical protein